MQGHNFQIWRARSDEPPKNLKQLKDTIIANRNFDPIETLEYGDHGLSDAHAEIVSAIQSGKKIALYADYDVDGTMSCVSWIWFLRAIGHLNFEYYIPDRFSEGYGLNMEAMKHLIEERGAELIITMDTGITANSEAAYCRSKGVGFICTDHHQIQKTKMPDCTILNPKLHPNPDYQELCGCGITFVLLRKIAETFKVPHEVWIDILALTGMATICDVVPLNGVNHRLARLGVDALFKSKRPVIQKLLKACSVEGGLDEKDIGFRLGPRINAVGRLEHAHLVIEAFVDEVSEPLIKKMGECNDRRKRIQSSIVEEADVIAGQSTDPITFAGGSWHQGVVGIAASKIAERYWRPTWLFERGDSLCKGSARSIPGFDVTAAMSSCGHLFEKFGGHKAAGGFAFKPENEAKIKAALIEYANQSRLDHPEIWDSQIEYDCALPLELVSHELLDCLMDLKPFGHGFWEPSFAVQAEVCEFRYYNDKVTGLPKHTAVFVQAAEGEKQKIMFFNQVVTDLQIGNEHKFLVTVGKNIFRDKVYLDMYAVDWAIH
jgi:single-stranded-DNA-specific exonuclease